MRHSVRVRLLVTLVFTVWAGALPAAASASNVSPVHIDPSSPVAKEYALPLAIARGSAPESGRSGGLFGSGIKRTSNARAAPAAYRVLHPGSGSGVLWMLVVGVLVVALGSAGGVALARRR